MKLVRLQPEVLAHAAPIAPLVARTLADVKWQPAVRTTVTEALATAANTRAVTLLDRPYTKAQLNAIKAGLNGAAAESRTAWKLDVLRPETAPVGSYLDLRINLQKCLERIAEEWGYSYSSVSQEKVGDVRILNRWRSNEYDASFLQMGYQKNSTYLFPSYLELENGNVVGVEQEKGLNQIMDKFFFHHALGNSLASFSADSRVENPIEVGLSLPELHGYLAEQPSRAKHFSKATLQALLAYDSSSKASEQNQIVVAPSPVSEPSQVVEPSRVVDQFIPSSTNPAAMVRIRKEYPALTLELAKLTVKVRAQIKANPANAEQTAELALGSARALVDEALAPKLVGASEADRAHIEASQELLISEWLRAAGSPKPHQL